MKLDGHGEIKSNLVVMMTLNIKLDGHGETKSYWVAW